MNDYLNFDVKYSAVQYQKTVTTFLGENDLLLPNKSTQGTLYPSSSLWCNEHHKREKNRG